MTLVEWTAAVQAALRTAGFDADVYQGFPLVRTPRGVDRMLELLQLMKRFPIAVEMSIYAEGALFLPPGSHAMRRPPEG